MSRFQTLTGVQLFYPSRLNFADAHIYFAQSPWGLSAVSQFQYWRPYLGEGRRRLLSNLSIDIGAWQGRLSTDEEQFTPRERAAGALDAVNMIYGDPNLLTTQEIAERIEAQIRECFGTISGATAPRASHYHIDDYIEFGDDNKPRRNNYPYLINLVDDWTNRPEGEPWSTHDGRQRYRIPGQGKYIDANGAPVSAFDPGTRIWVHDMDGYRVYLDSLVFAGTYTRTFTRLGTMESANESGRHAVNAILDHLASREPPPIPTPPPPPEPPWDTPTQVEPQYLWTPFGDYCETWNVEDHEVEDLRFAKLVDQYLYDAEVRANASRDTLMQAREYREDRPGPYSPPSPDPVHDTPHMFDLLDVDSLADLLDDDADALRLFDVLSSGLQALRESDSLEEAELSRLLLRVRTQLHGLFRTNT
jgi:hypothetical protein